MDIENKIEKYLNEGKNSVTITFNTRPFVNSHGKKPSGRGSWAFSFDGKLKDPEMAKREHNGTYLSPSMTYIDAKKWISAAIKAELSDSGKSHYVEVDVEG